MRGQKNMKKTFVLDQLFDGAPVRSFHKKTDIFGPSYTTDGLYRLISGRIRISAIMEDGQTMILNSVEPGEPFPLPLYFGVAAPPTVVYTAETDITAHWSSRADTDAFMRAHPEVLYELVKLIIEVLYGRINTLSRNTAEKKVLNLLLQLAARWAKPGQNLFEIKTTQQYLADAVNLSRESVNIILNRLEDNGVLTMARNKIFMDVELAKAELKRVTKPAGGLCEPDATTAEPGNLDLMR